MTQPDPQPIRKSDLPTIPSPEWEFHTWFPHPDGGGDMVPGQRQRGVLVRRRVSYSDWEPVRPDRWADEDDAAPAVSGGVSPATDFETGVAGQGRPKADSKPATDVAALRAAILREEADRIDATRADFPIAVQNGITWATAELRRHAAEPAAAGARAAATPDTGTVVHAVPLPGSNGISACCGRPPCEFVGERVTRDQAAVTCTPPAGGAPQPKGAP